MIPDNRSNTRWLLTFLAVLALSACELTTTTPTPVVKGTSAGATLGATETLASAASEIQDPVPSVEPISPTPTTNRLNTEGLSKEINPLTGLPVLDAELLERRPVAVKVTSYPRSNRPQWGLSLADIVYEYYHNNELTRFHAIFYGQNADLAGPIRSARLMDGYLMDTYGSILTFASADSRILAELRSQHPNWQLLTRLEGICPPKPVCRYEPLSVNFLLADTDEVDEFIEDIGGDNQRQSLEGMSFDEKRPLQGEDVERIYLRYSYAAYMYWDYDADSGKYLRYQDARDDAGGRGENYMLLTDRLNSKAITADNVVVLYVPHFHSVYKPAANGLPATEIVDMEFEGRGRAYAFRDGQAYEVEWVREGGKVLYLVTEEGEDFPFKPGTTWFQVMTDKSTVQREDTTWNFNFVFRRP